MPPVVALMLCVVFILYVFQLDYKQKPNVTSALWVPLIWMIIASSRFVSLWLDLGASTVSASDSENGSPIDRLIFTMLILFGILLLLKRATLTSRILKDNKWILVWLLYCGISIAWSDSPEIAIKRWVKGIGTVIMVLIVLTEPDPVESLKALVRRCAYALVPLSILFIKYYRHLGVGFDEWTGTTMYTGVADNKNALGRLCLVSTFFFFWALATMWRKRKQSLDKKGLWVNVVLLLMSLWLLLLSDSATSIGVLLIGLLVFVGLGMPIIKRNVHNAVILILISTIFLFSVEQMFGVLEYFIASLGRNMTFTDRVYLWKDLLNMGTNPIWGTGYESFWLGHRLDIIWGKYRWQPTESHNGYLEIYLELGVIGLSLLMGIIFVVGRNIQRTLIYDFDLGRFRMAVLIMVLLYNVTESAFKGVTLMWIMFLLIAIDTCRPQYLKSIGPGPRRI
jgi:O-antigen ligase